MAQAPVAAPIPPFIYQVTMRMTVPIALTTTVEKAFQHIAANMDPQWKPGEPFPRGLSMAPMFHQSAIGQNFITRVRLEGLDDTRMFNLYRCELDCTPGYHHKDLILDLYNSNLDPSFMMAKCLYDAETNEDDLSDDRLEALSEDLRDILWQAIEDYKRLKKSPEDLIASMRGTRSCSAASASSQRRARRRPSWPACLISRLSGSSPSPRRSSRSTRPSRACLLPAAPNQPRADRPGWQALTRRGCRPGAGRYGPAPAQPAGPTGLRARA